MIQSLRCVSCGTTYDPAVVDYTCPACGPRRGTLEVLYDERATAKSLSPDAFARTGRGSMWRYEALLPLTDLRFVQPLRVGWTPLYEFPSLARELNLSAFYVKDDGQNPTASYKDRASSLVVIKAQEKRRRVVTCASTGNAASSLAGFAAAAGLESVIFVPERAPEAKVAQLLVYGSRVFSVRGSYDDAYDLAAEAAEAFGWYNRSAAVNPYLVEGKKTGALEIAEQLSWNPPDAVFVGVGDGSVISGLCKGFEELQHYGILRSKPQVIGVQAEGASPLASAFNAYQGGDVTYEDVAAETLADSICVGKPRDVVKAIRYVSRNGGYFVTVSDDEIQAAILDLARHTGVFAEPAGAASFAGLRKLAKAGDLAGKRAAVVVSGNGLKDATAARRMAGSATVIDPTRKDLERHL
ncbi:MAG: threonine synthase [Candidatus Bipolaricaulota bacterium]